MSRARRAWLTLATLLAAGACGRDAGPLPAGAALGGYTDSGQPESYTQATLYGYMDGGAETFREYGISRAWIRRYVRGGHELLAELYAMKDADAASGLFSAMRRAGTEAELGAGCRGSVTESEAKLAKGGYYLVCRNEDPMARDAASVRDLCARVAARLSGECGVGLLFAGLPKEGRAPGTEVAVVGPLGFNQRPWLAALGTEGFRRGWLARYALASGSAEAFLAEYASPSAARQALATLPPSPDARLASAQRRPACRGPSGRRCGQPGRPGARPAPPRPSAAMSDDARGSLRSQSLRPAMPGCGAGHGDPEPRAA
jgi:hypothetical protein